MPARFSILTLAATASALVLLTTLLPAAAGALFLNLGNAGLARGLALPADAPERAAAFTKAAVALSAAEPASSMRGSSALARLELARSDPESAIRVLTQGGLAGSPVDPVTEYAWGEAEWQLHRPSEAFAHWKAAGAAEYFVREAHRAIDAHRWTTAEECAWIAVGIVPDSADAHYVLGDALSHQAPKQADALYEIDRAAALTQDPELLSTILSRKAEVHVELGDLDTALGLFKRAMSVAPLDARPRTGYALALLEGRPDARDEAVATLEQVVADSPWYTAAYIGLSRVAESSGDPASAERWLQRGLTRNPNDARLLYALGLLYARQQRVELARTTLIQALKYETRADALQSISRSLSELGP